MTLGNHGDHLHVRIRPGTADDPAGPRPYRPVTRREALWPGSSRCWRWPAATPRTPTGSVEAPPAVRPRRARSAPAWWPSATSAGDRPRPRWPGPWSAGRPRTGRRAGDHRRQRLRAGRAGAVRRPARRPYRQAAAQPAPVGDTRQPRRRRRPRRRAAPPSGPARPALSEVPARPAAAVPGRQPGRRGPDGLAGGPPRRPGAGAAGGGVPPPGWSCSRHDAHERVGRFWVPVLERHRVALVLNGHDHNYQRFVSAGGSPTSSPVAAGASSPAGRPRRTAPSGSPARSATTSPPSRSTTARWP